MRKGSSSDHQTSTRPANDRSSASLKTAPEIWSVVSSLLGTLRALRSSGVKDSGIYGLRLSQSNQAPDSSHEYCLFAPTMRGESSSESCRPWRRRSRVDRLEFFGRATVRKSRQR